MFKNITKYALLFLGGMIISQWIGAWKEMTYMSNFITASIVILSLRTGFEE